jgi:DNA-binding transcriptional ArsR family regulator
VFSEQKQTVFKQYRIKLIIGMAKVTLDMSTFKALASDTRLDILRTLDGKKMGLNEISKITKLNKATLHEHLSKLHEAGLVKRKEREGHKWVYYKLSWKGECLLHPENTRIVVLFTMTFIALWGGVIQLLNYVKGSVKDMNYRVRTLSPESEDLLDITKDGSSTTDNMINFGENGGSLIYQDPLLLNIAIIFFIIFIVILCVSFWRYRKNKTPKL